MTPIAPMDAKSAVPARRDITIDFVRGLCLPLMMIDQLRDHWLSLFTYRPVGFFCAAVVFVFLSGFAAGKFYSTFLSHPDPFTVYRRVWRRALQIYGLHLSVTTVAITLAAHTALGREIELAITHPWRALLDSALLHPSVPMLQFLPMYLIFLLFTPWLLRRFQSGQEKPVLAASFLLWLTAQAGVGHEITAWQFLFVPALYLGFLQRTQPLVKPLGTKVLNLALFGLMIALAMLRHAELFSLEAFSSAIPAWWIERSSLGPLVLLNLYLWVAFLWLVPEPLLRLARQGRVFIAMGHNAFAVFAWQVLLFYAFMSWFPQLYRFSILGQALVVCFAVACVVFPFALTVNYLIPASLSKRHP